MKIINQVPGKVRNPYCYKTRDSKGRLKNYSERFKLLKDAKKWYKNFGKNLEILFNRKLEMVKNIPYKNLKNVA